MSDSTEPRWQPPSLEQIAGVAGMLRDNRQLDDALDTPGAADFELKAATLEALVAIASATQRLVELQSPATPRIPLPVSNAMVVLGQTILELEVKQRSVQDVAGDGFEGGREVGNFAVLPGEQTRQLVDAVTTVGDWFSGLLRDQLAGQQT